MERHPKMMRRAAAVLALICSARLVGFGQEVTTPPQQQQQQTPAAAPAPPAPKKSNARPATNAAPSAVEPYDGATVAKMAEACVTLQTEAGDIEIEMLPGAAPETVRNFLNLTATGFFDTTTFNRVVKGFIIQGGNAATRPQLTEALIRRASRTIIDEPNSVKHERGIVSMARAAAPHTATTNFFILVGPAPHLDNTFAAFGRVLRGIDVVDAINAAPAENEKPEKPIQIKRAVVTRCPPPAPPAASPTPAKP